MAQLYHRKIPTSATGIRGLCLRPDNLGFGDHIFRHNTGNEENRDKQAGSICIINSHFTSFVLVAKFIRSKQCSGHTYTDGYDARVPYSLRLNTEAFYPLQCPRRKQLGIVGK